MTSEDCILVNNLEKNYPSQNESKKTINIIKRAKDHTKRDVDMKLEQKFEPNE